MKTGKLIIQQGMKSIDKEFQVGKLYEKLEVVPFGPDFKT